MLPVDELRRRQEQRLLPALAAWDEAKKNLEGAIALAEAREREYREIAEDVQRSLGALQLVLSMTQELEDAKLRERGSFSGVNQALPMASVEESRTSNGAATALQIQNARSDRPLPNGLVRVSSRRLFPANWRSKDTSLSILQPAPRLQSAPPHGK
jgi:hypothetical protein